jgi:predicted AAA+ superfamily ATPase
MLRKNMEYLIKWKNKKNKLPIVLLGARQVGKTYLLKEFAKKHYEDYIYLNFESDSYLKELYEKDLDPKRILSEIELYLDKIIKPDKTLIIFDEIQIAEKAITALKYFAEELPEYDIISAGSLLGVAVQRENFSFPVGKIEFMYLYPFMFDEFLIGIGKGIYIDKINSCYENNEAMPLPIHEKLNNLYKHYLCIGGMPAVINEYKYKEMNLQHFDRNIHQNIINAYIADMSKYCSGTESVKIQAIYKSIPEQLAGDNKKFKYSVVKKGSKASEFGSSIEWLMLSNLNIECSLIKRAEYPLSVYKEKGYFKVYLSDVGLLMSLSKMPFKKVLLENEHNLFKGAITENYVAQHLKVKNKELYYWKKNSYEVDFLVDINEEIIPIEVKSSTNTRSRSLKEYIRSNNPEYAIRFSTKNFGFDGKIKAIPLYAAYCINN